MSYTKTTGVFEKNPKMLKKLVFNNVCIYYK